MGSEAEEMVAQHVILSEVNVASLNMLATIKVSRMYGAGRRKDVRFSMMLQRIMALASEKSAMGHNFH